MPIGLILLSLVPVLAGAARIAELSGGAEITPDNARFFASPLPVVVHILSVTIYALLGAFQFAPSLRRRKPKWHRTAGRILVPAGLAAALSGLWMTLFYALPESDGALLNMMRLVFGSAMLLSIILGVTAVRQRDFPRHGDWMMHGYAIGLGAGTQVLTHLPWFLLFGVPDEFTKAMLMGAGWVINLAVAEWVIRKRRARYGRSRRAPTVSL
ncbi:MAG: membrane protein [Chloroflexota bacterium]|nr:MAG: membrane protein [Chloroflexota bacterium]